VAVSHEPITGLAKVVRGRFSRSFTQPKE
jgi:hypothetical protein